jgi:hypothetical protein
MLPPVSLPTPCRLIGNVPPLDGCKVIVCSTVVELTFGGPRLSAQITAGPFEEPPHAESLLDQYEGRIPSRVA